MVEQAYYQKPGQVIAAAVVLPVLDTLTVILRFYVRRRQRLPLQADDWLTVPAVVYPTPGPKAKRDLAPRSALTETNSEITITSQVGFYSMASWKS